MPGAARCSVEYTAVARSSYAPRGAMRSSKPVGGAAGRTVASGNLNFARKNSTARAVRITSTSRRVSRLDRSSESAMEPPSAGNARRLPDGRSLAQMPDDRDELADGVVDIVGR